MIAPISWSTATIRLCKFGVFLLAVLGNCKPGWAIDEFEYLIGKWTPTTGPNIGAPFVFTKAFAGYDALIPWWGQTSILESGGEYGSHVKVVGAKQGVNASCYYYIVKLDQKRMAWNLKHADRGSCPESLVFEREVASVVSFLERARKFFEEDDLDTATAELNAANKIAPDSAEVYSLRGDVNYQKDNNLAAIADYSEAIRLSKGKDRAVLYAKRAKAYVDANDAAAAIANFTDAINLDPKAAWYSDRASSHAKQKDYELAISDVEQALRKDPDNKWYKRQLRRYKKANAESELKFCNDYSEKVFVAIVGERDPELRTTKVEGWWNIEPNGCRSVGSYVRSSTFYWFAMTKGRKVAWRAKSGGRSTCVNYSKMFDRLATTHYSCGDDEQLESFVPGTFSSKEATKTILID